MTKDITVSWEIWSDGEKRFQAFKKANGRDPNYVTIEGNQIQLKEWKDSQNRVNEFKNDNNKNPLTVRLIIPGDDIIVDIEKLIKKYGTVTPPTKNKGEITNGYYYCSCGEKGYKYGRWKVTFVNRCAFADEKSHQNKSSKLKWKNKKEPAPLEGEWTCDGCGADYCAVDGKEKISKSTKRLVKVNEEKMPPKI